MKKMILLFIISVSLIAKNIDTQIPFEFRPDSGCIIFTNRTHDTLTLDTIAIIDTNGIWHKYGNFSDSVKAPKFYADTLLLEDSLKVYRKADTILFTGSSTCRWDLSDFDILFKTGTHTIDNLVPYTQDSLSSKMGSVLNPYGEGYLAFLYSFLTRSDTTELRIDSEGYAEIYIDTVGTDSIIVEIGATRRGVAIE